MVAHLALAKAQSHAAQSTYGRGVALVMGLADQHRGPVSDLVARTASKARIGSVRVTTSGGVPKDLIIAPEKGETSEMLALKLSALALKVPAVLMDQLARMAMGTPSSLDDHGGSLLDPAYIPAAALSADARDAAWLKALSDALPTVIAEAGKLAPQLTDLAARASGTVPATAPKDPHAAKDAAAVAAQLAKDAAVAGKGSAVPPFRPNGPKVWLIAGAVVAVIVGGAYMVLK